MNSITAVRSQGPGPAPAATMRQDQPARTQAVEAARPASDPRQTGASVQVSATAASVDARMAGRTDSHHPGTEARVAAEAARAAYIKASIVAGVSPLPLP